MKTWPNELSVLLNDENIVQLEVTGEYFGSCPNCNGAGMMAVYQIKAGPYRTCPGQGKWLDLGPGKAGWYTGEMKVGACPICKGGDLQSWLVRNSGLSGSDLEISLQDFLIDGPFEGKGEALAICRDLLAENQRPTGYITFWGNYGVGKTHLIKGLVNGFRMIEVTAHYARLSDLLAEIRERFSADNGMILTEAVINEYRHMQVLCVDEINGVNFTNWSLETINRLLDDRYSRRSECLTVMALNQHPSELPVELQYLHSRMKEGHICEVAGIDVREAKAPALPDPGDKPHHKDWTV